MVRKKRLDRIRTHCIFIRVSRSRCDCAVFKSCAAKKQKLNTHRNFISHPLPITRSRRSIIKDSIPYKIIGGIQFYERKEIKDILAYLKLVVNPFDRASFFRVINCPLRGLGINLKNSFIKHGMQIYLQHLKILRSNLLRQQEVTGTKKDALQFCKII